MEWVARTETRAFSPSFSPFTHTTAAGNGIANPSTLHASWQLVISRPVLRQHTPRYVSPSPSCRRPCRSAFDARVSARPRVSTTPCLSLSLSFSLPFSFTYFLPLHFPSLFSLTVLHIRFPLFFTFNSFRRFSPSRYFSSEFFSLLSRVSYFVSSLLTPISRPLLVSLVPYYFSLVTFFAIERELSSSSLSPLPHFHLSFHARPPSPPPAPLLDETPRTRINYFRIFGAQA